MPENEERLRQLIAENIAYYRKQSGDTQADLAEKLNYSDKSISKWERGDVTTDVFVLMQIAEIFGGGGHRLAAGITIKGTVEEAARLLVAEAVKHLPKEQA